MKKAASAAADPKAGQDVQCRDIILRIVSAVDISTRMSIYPVEATVTEGVMPGSV